MKSRDVLHVCGKAAESLLNFVEVGVTVTARGRRQVQEVLSNVSANRIISLTEGKARV